MRNTESTRWKQQLNKNNKGSSLVTVLLISSIVAAIVTVVLAIVILNVFMKRADNQGQKAFYDAESALEEIRAGLAHDVSSATSEAYIATLSNYSNWKDNERTKKFNDQYSAILAEKITCAGTNLYKLPDEQSGDSGDESDEDIINKRDKLIGYIKDDSYRARTEIVTELDEAGNSLNIVNSETADGIVLKNVHVRYTDDANYVSEIKTDIVLEYPPIDFKDASSIENILTYGIIANEAFDPVGSSTVNVYGNAYLGSKMGEIGTESTVDADPVEEIKTSENNVIRSGAKLNFHANNGEPTNVISGGDLNLRKNAKIEVDENVSLWADSILLNDAEIDMNTASSAFIKDDIVFGNNSFADFKGKLIMFGNPWVAQMPNYVTSAEVRELAKNDMPSYSSSILMLGTNSGLDFSGVSTMVIGGSAYVDTESHNGKSGISGNKNVTTGQSMMLKSDQRAYMVPADMVGVKENGTAYENGKSNPMTGAKFAKLQEEIRKELNLGANDPIPNRAYANMTGLDQFVYGVWAQKHQAVDGANATVPPMPEEYLPQVRVCFYATNNGGSIVYFFIDFQSMFGEDVLNPYYVPAEAQYNAWYLMTQSVEPNLTPLRNNLVNYYATKGIKLPSGAKTDTSRMYYTGDIFTTEDNEIVIQDMITRPTFTRALYDEYARQSGYYQDAYFTLRKLLSTRYELFASKPGSKDKDLFGNLINNISSSKSFEADTGEKAVISSKGYTYSGDENINVIIAEGDVLIENNFEGMVVAKGKIYVKPGLKITANAEKARRALQARDEEGDCAANYVIDAGKYMPGWDPSDEEDDESDGLLSMKDYVTYRNWTRQ